MGELLGSPSSGLRHVDQRKEREMANSQLSSVVQLIFIGDVMVPTQLADDFDIESSSALIGRSLRSSGTPPPDDRVDFTRMSFSRERGYTESWVISATLLKRMCASCLCGRVTSLTNYYRTASRHLGTATGTEDSLRSKEAAFP
mmetsp:Transcript_17688/g.36697  ORF Transcript_17688/g.36697 Transcript_17688/m.36697 type:complete len:144 (-) Transcript_17688:39-470(-)